MKLIVLSLLLAILFFACKSKKEVSLSYENNTSVSESVVEAVPEEMEEIPVIVKEELIVSVKEAEPVLPNHNFFVIMGSFKVLNNATKFQSQLKLEGFDSQLLQNEQGLFRVSIYSCKEINEARTKVYSIRRNYPKYNDVWLLKKSN